MAWGKSVVDDAALAEHCACRASDHWVCNESRRVSEPGPVGRQSGGGPRENNRLRDGISEPGPGKARSGGEQRYNLASDASVEVAVSQTRARVG